uniref:Uncharacterized protein n=1 Tax=viral metagenome TaxID=1070528 RepID=A0A6M3JC45_9ZZZZ
MKKKTARRFLRKNETTIVRLRMGISQPPSFHKYVKKAIATLVKEDA